MPDLSLISFSDPDTDEGKRWLNSDNPDKHFLALVCFCQAFIKIGSYETAFNLADCLKNIADARLSNLSNLEVEFTTYDLSANFLRFALSLDTQWGIANHRGAAYYALADCILKGAKIVPQDLEGTEWEGIPVEQVKAEQLALRLYKKIAWTDTMSELAGMKIKALEQSIPTPTVNKFEKYQATIQAMGVSVVTSSRAAIRLSQQPASTSNTSSSSTLSNVNNTGIQGEPIGGLGSQLLNININNSVNRYDLRF